MSYHNELITAFKASDTEMVVYLKRSTETNEYAVKVKRLRTVDSEIITITHSLSTALYAFADTIAQYTNGFTRWDVLT